MAHSYIFFSTLAEWLLTFPIPNNRASAHEAGVLSASAEFLHADLALGDQPPGVRPRGLTFHKRLIVKGVVTPVGLNHRPSAAQKRFPQKAKPQLQRGLRNLAIRSSSMRHNFCNGSRFQWLKRK